MKITIARTLFAFAVLVTAGLIGSLVVSITTLNRVKVNGPIFAEIIDGKDLVADILPPPLYLVEAYMLAGEAALHPDLVKENAERISKLKSDYETRRAYWKASNLPAHLNAKLQEDVLGKGDQFWAEMTGQFIPALLANDRNGTHKTLDALKDSFHVHEKAVVELVAMTDQYTQGLQTRTATTLFWSVAIAIGVCVASIVLFIAGIIYIHFRAINAVTRITHHMSTMAAGDLDTPVPMTGRRDEIGEMAAALQVFRDAGREKLRLEQVAEAERALSDAERSARESATRLQAQNVQNVLEKLGAGLHRLADCNIRMTIDDPFEGDFERLRQDFNMSIATFQATLVQVLDQTQLLHNNGQEMRSAADNLARRTEQQAAALEQTSAALEQVTATVRNSTDRTIETRKLVKEARDCAAQSGDVVRNAIEAMHRIESASSEINQIIGVIDEIAFQTNLLALNAGVEAARAGDAGKGFAVVATEVRELAQRSAKAAKEIKGLINHSTQEVEQGVVLVGETGKALGQIEGYVASITENVDAIATAASEQFSGLHEISAAVNEIDQMTQQNAAMVEETTAISHTLADGSALLTTLVSSFKLNRRSAIREPGQTVTHRGGAGGKNEQRRVA